MKKPKLLLLACAFLLTAAATRPAKSDSCQSFHRCEDCPNHQTHLCTITVCGSVTSISCLACGPECILPPD